MKLKKIIQEIEEPTDNTLKYECKYVNGGFNDGVKLEPTSGGKIALSISIYGGGDPKSVNIPATGDLKTIVQGYEVAFKNKDQDGVKLEPEIEQKLAAIKEEISMQVIAALKEFDVKIKQIILNTIQK